MKIYLAGKITGATWRRDILGSYSPNHNHGWDWETDWPVLPRIVLHQHDYTGPYFCSDNHGGYGVDHGAPGIGENHDAGAMARSALVPLCLRAIASSDLLFAWIDRPDIAGTLVEIGYARGRGIPVAIGYPHELGGWCGDAGPGHDFWFVDGLADVVACGNEGQSPAAAAASCLASALRRREAWRAAKRDLLARAHARCGSKFEATFLDAFLAAGFELLPPIPGDDAVAEHRGILLFQQYEVGRYRLDYALVAGPLKIAIEADSFRYHDQTPEAATRDKARDRYLQGEGWRVLRYTDFETKRGPAACVAEAIRVALRLRREGA
jgi:very-short-patch-repair endonuclease